MISVDDAPEEVALAQLGRVQSFVQSNETSMRVDMTGHRAEAEKLFCRQFLSILEKGAPEADLKPIFEGPIADGDELVVSVGIKCGDFAVRHEVRYGEVDKYSYIITRDTE